MESCFIELHCGEIHLIYLAIQAHHCTTTAAILVYCGPACTPSATSSSRFSIRFTIGCKCPPPCLQLVSTNSTHTVCRLPRRRQLPWIRDALNVNDGSRWGAAATCVCRRWRPCTRPLVLSSPPPLHFTPNSKKHTHTHTPSYLLTPTHNPPAGCVRKHVNTVALLPLCTAYTVAIREVWVDKHVTQLAHTHTTRLPYLWMSMGEYWGPVGHH